jgi:hypothetical protein
MRRGRVLLFCAGVVACGARKGAPGDPGTGSALPCDVANVLSASCGTCHGASPAYGAPMPLATLPDLRAPARSDPSRKVYELVASRTHDAARPMPQPPNARLDATSQAILDEWISAGAPGTSAVCPAPKPPWDAAAPVLSCAPDVHLAPRGSYPLPADKPDIYLCYGVELTVDAKRHLIGVGPRVDDARIVHHMLLFQSETPLDPAPAPCGVIQSAAWRIAGVWAPGGHGFELPPETGFPLEGTTHYVVQVHYSSPQHLVTVTDTSGFDLCTTPTLRANDADILAFGTLSIRVPAHGTLDLTCSYQVPQAMHVVAAMPHMHKIGTYISSARGADDLGTANPWSFEGQAWQKIGRDLATGDVVRTRCAWSNPTDAPVQFGEYTEEEMCFDFEIYYPRIPSRDWKWLYPAMDSSCVPTPH